MTTAKAKRGKTRVDIDEGVVMVRDA
jgi:hypothetical protein